MKNRPPVSYLDPPVYYESANLETPLFIWDPPVYLAGESTFIHVISFIIFFQKFTNVKSTLPRPRTMMTEDCVSAQPRYAMV